MPLVQQGLSRPSTNIDRHLEEQIKKAFSIFDHKVDFLSRAKGLTPTQVRLLQPLHCCVLVGNDYIFVILSVHDIGSISIRSFHDWPDDDIYDNRAIVEDIWRHINEARILISELTGKNANVFYETGIAHTIGKEVILITQSMEDVPFDLKHLRCIVYDYTLKGMEKFENKLKSTILHILSGRDS